GSSGGQSDDERPPDTPRRRAGSEELPSIVLPPTARRSWPTRPALTPVSEASREESSKSQQQDGSTGEDRTPSDLSASAVTGASATGSAASPSASDASPVEHRSPIIAPGTPGGLAPPSPHTPRRHRSPAADQARSLLGTPSASALVNYSRFVD